MLLGSSGDDDGRSRQAAVVSDALIQVLLARSGDRHLIVRSERTVVARPREIVQATTTTVARGKRVQPTRT